MSAVLLAGLGGMVGAVLRYLVSGWVARRTGNGLPWGTLVVNASGSLLAGVLLGLPAGPGAITAVKVGVLGAFTTYSTFAYETLAYLESGARARAFANVALNLFTCLPAAAAGWGLSRALWGG